MKKTLAFRFDVDSVRCTEVGIPRLVEVADRCGVRFSFFVNMGYSFNWGHNLRHFAAKKLSRSKRSAPTPARGLSLPTTSKLGWGGILKTMFLNPQLGERYRRVFDGLHDSGHELALHGGTDHVIWQRGLSGLSEQQVRDLLHPAFERFAARYGEPRGFASPGFVHNDIVLRLLDEYGFAYASDMPGDEPFRPRNGSEYEHFQVPVNVMGVDNVPLVEQYLALGRTQAEIVEAAVEMITDRDFALMYGHPYVEGVHAGILESVIGRVRDTHDVVTVEEYLERWKARDG